MDYSIDEARAARDEAVGDKADGVIFHGERFPLPVRLPIAFLEHLATYLALTHQRREEQKSGAEQTIAVGAATAELFTAAELLLTPEGWARFKALGADLDDVLALLQAVLRAFKVGENPAGQEPADAVGESQASGSPSSDGGALSRQTGNGSTDETSDETSTDPNVAEPLSDVSGPSS